MEGFLFGLSIVITLINVAGFQFGSHYYKNTYPSDTKIFWLSIFTFWFYYIGGTGFTFALILTRPQ